MERTETTGIENIIRDRAVLTSPPGEPDLRYGLGHVFQLAPRLAGILLNVWIPVTKSYGFMNGTDIAVFGDPAEIKPEQIFSLTRTEYSTDPDTGGRNIHLRSPMVGGFIPENACTGRSLHPFAGTGFNIGQAHDFPIHGEEEFQWWNPGRQDMLEVFQLVWKGGRFSSVRTSRNTQSNQSPLCIGNTGWRIIAPGLTTAIPDDTDLLLPVLAGRLDDSKAAVGICRWAVRKGTWQPVEFFGVDDAGPGGAGANFAGTCAWFEPSLVRDRDGSLLFCARGQDGDDTGTLVRVWRSGDAGRTWTVAIDAPNVRQQSPVTINSAADTTPYLVSNPFIPNFVTGPKTGRGRDTLCLWPMDETRTSLKKLIRLRDASADLGPPPPSPDPDWPELWMIDHPAGSTVRLADGKWHHLLAYRVIHSPLYRSHGTPPSPRTGCYIDQIVSKGPVLPTWTFMDP